MGFSNSVKYFIIFNVIMVLFLFLSSQFVLYSVEARREVISGIGLTIDTSYVGPIEYTPPYGARNDILNYPLIIFIISLIGNAILLLRMRKESKTIAAKTNLTE
jgi:hypothetical protein